MLICAFKFSVFRANCDINGLLTASTFKTSVFTKSNLESKDSGPITLTESGIVTIAFKTLYPGL